MDEFQDTDPIQAEMMFLLTGIPADEPDWRRVTPAPGSLFVVGDPKQSIYRFRRADIATYQEVKERMVATGGRVVRLTASFRSLPAVAEWVNRAFEPILAGRGNDYQAAFAPLEPVRADANGDTVSGVYRITVPKNKGNSANEIVRVDAGRITSWIAWACAGNLSLARTDDELRSGLTTAAQPGDFLILLPVKAHIGVYARALERAGLPAAISGGDILGESTPLGWFLQLCDAIADPEDPVKLLAVLRGPLFGVSDAELYRFTATGGRFSFLHVPEPGVPQSAEPVAEALVRMNHFRRRARQEPALVALEGMIEELGLYPYAAGSANGRTGAGALAAAFEMLRAQSDEDTASFAGAVARLHAIVEAGEGEAVDMKPAPLRAVRLMNLHKAKGLEAPVVFLAAPARQKEHPPETHVDRRHTPARSYYQLKGVARLIGQPPGWDEAAREEEQFLKCEQDRLLYVAATRARNILVISRYEGNTDADLWARLHPWVCEAEELPAVQTETAERPRVDIHPGEIEMEMGRLAAKRAICIVPGYEHLAVTALARRAVPAGADEVAPAADEDLDFEENLSSDTEEMPPSVTPEGSLHGAAWGTAVHRLLDAVFRGLTQERWREVGALILTEEKLPADALDELVASVERVWESPMGLRVRNALEVHTEVPFGMAATRAELGLGDDGPETVLLEGAIDLVFREADGWVIVDYKTDVGAADKVDDLAIGYAPQVRMYGRFWREQMGETVKEMVIFFLRSMSAVVVE